MGGASGGEPTKRKASTAQQRPPSKRQRAASDGNASVANASATTAVGTDPAEGGGTPAAAAGRRSHRVGTPSAAAAPKSSASSEAAREGGSGSKRRLGHGVVVAFSGFDDAHKDLMAHKVAGLNGRVVDSLNRSGLLESTFVFFASDNGAHEEGGHNHSFFNSTGGLRGFKRSLYEGGARSPSMVVGPRVPRASRSALPWAFWDVLPTLAELANASDQVGADDVDGASFAAGLTAPGSLDGANRTLYFTWGDGPTHTKGYTARRGDYKGVVTNCSHFYNNQSAYYQKPSPDDAWALYDLAHDPSEERDIAAEQPDTLKKAGWLFLQLELVIHFLQPILLRRCEHQK